MFDTGVTILGQIATVETPYFAQYLEGQPEPDYMAVTEMLHNNNSVLTTIVTPGASIKYLVVTVSNETTAEPTLTVVEVV